MDISADCPECGKRFEEFIEAIPANKYVTVDVPSDIWVAEKVISISRMRQIVRVANKILSEDNSKIQFKV